MDNKMGKKSLFYSMGYGLITVLFLICCVLLVGVVDNNRTLIAIGKMETDDDFALAGQADESEEPRTAQETSSGNAETVTESPSDQRGDNLSDVSEKAAGKNNPEKKADDEETQNNETEPEQTTEKKKNDSSSAGDKLPEKKTVYLTFDDGPTERTWEILDVLDEYGVKATFFVIYRDGCEELLREIDARGHTIGLHSYSHDFSSIYSSVHAYFEDLNKLSDIVEEATGKKPMIVRLPGGSSNTVSRSYKKGIMTDVTNMLLERGYQYFDWNCDSGDASGRNVPVSTIISKTKNGIYSSAKNVCVLMHDSAGKKTTIKALPDIIEHFRESGYTFETLTVESYAFHHTVNN